MSDCRFSPSSLSKIEQLESFDPSRVMGVVISTGLHSPVNASYTEVVMKSRMEFPNKPILLASMIDYENMKRSLTLNFAKEGIDFELLSIDEASSRNQLDSKKDFVVIQKSDITDQNKYPVTKSVIEKFFG